MCVVSTISSVRRFAFMLILRARRPNIVHFFLPKAYLVGAPIAMFAGVPIKIMSRRSLNDYQAGHPILRKLELRLHHRMTAILGNARSVVRQLRDQEGVPSERLGLIYSGIDAGKFHKTGLSAEGRSALELAPGTLALIIVANLIAYKGHSDLLARAGLGQAATAAGLAAVHRRARRRHRQRFAGASRGGRSGQERRLSRGAQRRSGVVFRV